SSPPSLAPRVPATRFHTPGPALCQRRLRRILCKISEEVRMARCPWCGEDPLYQRYHDQEWGVPVHDDRTLFEFLTLEGAQAGLSWITILRKRERYREVFADFDPAKVARFTPARVEQLLRSEEHT